MKKFFKTFALVLLLIPCVFAFAGCKEEPKQESIAETYNSQNVERNINAVAEKKGGIYIKMKVSTSTNETEPSMILAYGRSGDLHYFSTDGHEMIYDMSDENKVVIYDKLENSDWTKSEFTYSTEEGQNKSYYEDAIKSAFASIKVQFELYAQYEILPALKTSAEVAGRDCAKYVVEPVDGFSLFTHNIYIDKETGACLKMEVSTTFGENTVFKASIECLEFKTGYQISIPQVEEI